MFEQAFKNIDDVLWKDSKEALFVRQLGRKTPRTFELYREVEDLALLYSRNLVLLESLLPRALTGAL